MGLFDFFFGGSRNKADEPNIRFGRFSEIYKSPAQLEAWKKSFAAFENEEFEESYQRFFDYLTDPTQNSVKYWKEGDAIHFEILQGSKKMTGVADKEKVKVSTKVVHCERLNVGFMRRLIDQNYGLKHSRFSLDDDNNICMKFDSFVIDGSPFKLYAGIKEMALKADKLDDLLIDQFDMLKAIETDHIESLPVAEVDAKYELLQKAHKEAIARIEKLHPTKDAIAISIVLRYLIYRLDYLIQSEGFMLDLFEQCHTLIYSRDQRSIEQKNNAVIKKLEELMKRSREDFDKEMYKVPATFGITTPVNHELVTGTIDTELANMDWFRTNSGYEDISVATAGYLATYCLFNFAVPQPDREYFHLLVEIIETEFFKTLGIDHGYYNPEKKKFDRSEIRNEIISIAKSNKEKFPKINPNTSILVYKSLPHFVKSFILMIKGLNLTPADK